MLALCVAERAYADPPNLEIADPLVASVFVGKVTSDAIAALGDHTSAPDAAHARMRQVITRSFNLRYMSLLAIGAYRRDLKEDVLEAYEASFGDYLLGRYASLLEAQNPRGFEILGAERAGARDALVHTVIDGGAAPIHADWRVRMFDGAPRIIDLTVEGFSITLHQRDEIGAFIKGAGITGFIDHIHEVAGSGSN
jgi:phospholipid transport system substrate-binding protein